MKAALIPPIPMLNEFGHGSFHLLLSHLCSNQTYLDHYQMERARGAYLVLDNSAHEFDIGQRADVLIDQAISLKAQEIVVPDQLDDAEGTIESALSAMEVWFEGDRAAEMRALDPALMFVPQGKDEKEWVECFKELLRLQTYVAKNRGARTDFVIGLSKDYEVWDGGLYHLIADYLIPIKYSAEKAGVKVHVHLLGWGRNLWELKTLANIFPWIRSTDSAKPFVYGLRGIELIDYLEKDPPKYPKRNKGYFSQYMTTQQRRISRRNVKVFKQLAEDTSG